MISVVKKMKRINHGFCLRFLIIISISLWFTVAALSLNFAGESQRFSIKKRNGKIEKKKRGKWFSRKKKREFEREGNGRARCSLRAADVPRAAHIPDGSFRSVHMDRYRPSYNVSPGYCMPVVRREDMSDGHGAVLHCMKWGLIPSFTKKNEKPDHYKMFNARSESINEKASFRRLVPNNRCIVAVEGFYEWKKDGSKKQPYYIHLKDGRPLVFAALYDSWRDSEGETLYTFTILTTSSASTLQWLHDRMPVILGDKESTDVWLSSSSSSKHDVLLKPYENSDLVWYPVTPAMGKPSFNGPECIEEVQLKTESKNHNISKFFSKKEATNDHDSNPKHTSLSSDFMKSNMLKSVKDEIKIEGEAEISSRTDKESSDLKSNVSAISQEGATKWQVKRDYDEFKADPDPNPTIGETDKLCSSPPKKRGGFKSADNKQPTLLSYFGKR